MELATITFFTGPEGCALLDELAGRDTSEANLLPLLTELRRTLAPERAGAALSLARQRTLAAAKFSRAADMFFTPDALEQASSEPVSAWRARRFAGAGYSRVADLGCGVGGDTLALAGIPGAQVVGLDRDPVRLVMARANVAAYGRAAHMICADLADALPLRDVPAAFFDPARRDNGRRLFSVRDYQPPLDVLTRWSFDGWAVKLSPGVNLDELRSFQAAGAGVEFVSLGGDLKEAVLWGGAFGFAGCAATRLDDDGMGETLWPEDVPAPPLSPPRAYLYEPDPAIIRAGLLGELAAELGLAMYRLDETIAYLTADAYVPSRWARAWPVIAWQPFHLKRLRADLRARGIGRVTVKKRGSPLMPEELVRKLRLDGAGDSAVVVLTRLAGQHSAILCGEKLD